MVKTYTFYAENKNSIPFTCLTNNEKEEFNVMFLYLDRRAREKNFLLGLNSSSISPENKMSIEVYAIYYI